MEDGESDCRVAQQRRGEPRLYGELCQILESTRQQILALHEAGDRALMSADLAVLARIFADDYVQYNEAGKAFHQAGCAEQFSDGSDSLSVDCFDRTQDSRLRRHRGRARLGIRRSRSQRKAVPPCATFTSTFCGNAMGSGSWWRRSWRGRQRNSEVRPVHSCSWSKSSLPRGAQGCDATPQSGATGSASATRGTRRSRPAATTPMTASNLWKYLPSERQFSPSFMPK